MSTHEDRESQLRHELGNKEQEKTALKGMVRRAVDEIDELVDSDCEPEAKEKAERTADKLRRASDM